MGKRILVASDLSEASTEALEQARGYAASDGATLAVCHVLPNLFGVSALYAPRNEASIAQAAELEARLRDLLARKLAQLFPARQVEIFIEHGDAYAEIVRRAELWGADLVVVGSHGPGRRHIGMVAERVVRSTHCAVLVARPGPRRGVVVAATDFSDPSLAAISAGAEESRRRDSRFVVVHAVDFAGLAVTVEEMFLNATQPHAGTDVDQQLRNTVAAKLHALMARLGAIGDVRVLQGSPAAAIVQYAEDAGAELIVVGNRGRTGLIRLALGSIAERVVHTADCSVLTVRA